MDIDLLPEAFVELADTLVAGFDIIEFLQLLTDRSVQLLDASAAGLLLADPRGDLRVVAASSERARLVELFQVQNDEGPCLDCFRPASPSRPPTWARNWGAGRISPRPPAGRDSPLCRPCRCGCARRPLAR